MDPARPTRRRTLTPFAAPRRSPSPPAPGPPAALAQRARALRGAPRACAPPLRPTSDLARQGRGASHAGRSATRPSRLGTGTSSRPRAVGPGHPASSLAGSTLPSGGPDTVGGVGVYGEGWVCTAAASALTLVPRHWTGIGPRREITHGRVSVAPVARKSPRSSTLYNLFSGLWGDPESTV